jgi:hypothetical protein
MRFERALRVVIRFCFGIPEPSIEEKFFEKYAERILLQNKRSVYTFSARPKKLNYQ